MQNKGVIMERFTTNGCQLFLRHGIGGGVSIPLFTLDEQRQYIQFVELCHTFVEEFLESNPSYRYSAPGNGYYGTLKLANPDLYAQIDDWTRLRQQRIADLKDEKTGKVI